MDWFVGHMVGDYLLQTNYQAENKKHGWWPCFSHVLTYTLCIWLFTQWPVWKLAMVFGTHYLQDRSQLVKWFNTVTHKNGEPWLHIVVDNTLHMVVLHLLSKAPNLI
ncbi:MAG TPA: DUF3307 domain-containing protein [Armatimonadota bacterium]|jgi:hypothetical protein